MTRPPRTTTAVPRVAQVGQYIYSTRDKLELSVDTHGVRAPSSVRQERRPACGASDRVVPRRPGSAIAREKSVKCNSPSP
eukprot:1181761-Prymnesium_polylepis.1